MTTLLWGILPYVILVLLIGGLIWRYRYDKFGWTTRSSQLYESKLLRWASPAFHYGILFVLAGHVMGLLIPESWTDKLGVNEHAYHLMSLIGGTAAGVLTVAGIVLLIYRRRTTGPVFLATTRNDKLMYLVLLAAIVLGMVAKLTHASGEGYNYRHTISPWLRSIFTLQPKTELMVGVPVLYQIHVVVGLALIALVPFSRLVHMFSAPLQYLFRPYIVYRSRDTERLTARPERRGWERIGQ
ncbi:respiratory nitrate reductase subunit gamma [Streptomyces sp. A7024]|uniref:Nitrate reductase-like protein NarX n=1 Tax=Streptomyces coryli TaxID=1128680 RepID=A0A6G4TZ46_9ACTN|nr:respiratory nitrate reductase subunit gamma [Streptomyces coryli]NGN64398.1 respiratory nitrate reductase subunit gamma [Streptomyces coryli]